VGRGWLLLAFAGACSGGPAGGEADGGESPDQAASADDLSAASDDLATAADLSAALDLTSADACAAAFVAGIPSWYLTHAPGYACIPRDSFRVATNTLACCDSSCGGQGDGGAGCAVMLVVHDAALGDGGTFLARIDITLAGSMSINGALGSQSCDFTASAPNSLYQTQFTVDDDGGVLEVVAQPGGLLQNTQLTGCSMILLSLYDTCQSEILSYLSLVVPGLSQATLDRDTAMCPR
jgi:hypothetical protein